MYTDDLPHTAGLLHAALVKSARPHARITSLDASPALQVQFIPFSHFQNILRFQEVRAWKWRYLHCFCAAHIVWLDAHLNAGSGPWLHSVTAQCLCLNPD